MLRFTANLSVLFTEVELEQRFSLAKKQGFNAVEIQFPYGLNAETIRTKLQEHQLQLVLFNVAADDLLQGGEGLAAVPEKKEHFKAAVIQACGYAKILKPDAINILPGRCFNKERSNEYLETFKDNLRLALSAFSPLGIKTVFEAINTHDMPNFIVHNSQQMLAILDELNHPDLLMQYDIYHMLMMQEQAGDFIKQQAHKIGHIQFADCPGRHEPGTGTANFEKLFKTIKNSNYAGWVGAEYNPNTSSATSFNWLTHFY